MKSKSTIYILGGGPSALGLAHGLAKSSYKFVLIEKDNQLGGLAKTVVWNDYGSHDLGPHKIFSTDPVVLREIHALLPESDWLKREKVSSIYMSGVYLPYPPSPFSLIGVYGIPKFLSMTIGYFWAALKRIVRLSSRDLDQTFEEDLVNRVGRGLYESLFRPIAIKLWGDPAVLDSKLSKGRVQTPSLVEVALRLLKLKKTSEFEATTFDYPKAGLQQLWNSVFNQASASGQFMLNTEIIEIEIVSNIVRGLTIRNGNGQIETISVQPEDHIFSTLPLGLLAKMVKSTSQAIRDAANRSVILNDLILVFLFVKNPNVIKESWVFVPDPDIIFHRISEQESFDPDMVKHGSILCCEIMSSQNRPLSDTADSKLIDDVVRDLGKMGYQVVPVASKVTRLPKSYPVYRAGYEADLKSVIGHFDQIKNLKSIGRQGAFNYIGTLDAFDIGLGAAKWAVESPTTQKWVEERARTEHYPVLD